MKHSKKRIASIIVLSVIIAAGALFTAVYDVLYRYNTTNTTILNAATVDKTGETSWSVVGGVYNGNETTTCNFDEGTYMVMLVGQNGSVAGSNAGSGAVCLAFYKGNSMTVQIGVGGGSTIYDYRGGGYTSVITNFALPTGYSGTKIAVAGAAGGGVYSSVHNGYSDPLKMMDATFAGWVADGWSKTVTDMGEGAGNGSLNENRWIVAPATQQANGFGGNPFDDSDRGANALTFGDDAQSGSGGGAGYYNGGYGYWRGDPGGGGSCTPWCYPLETSDIQNGPTYTADNQYGKKGTRMRNDHPVGVVSSIKLDPLKLPNGGEVSYGNTVKMVGGGSSGETPYSFVKSRVEFYQVTILGIPDPNYDCGIRVGWVYSCSEDGEKWGAGSDRLRSETEQDVWHNCAVIKPIYIKYQL